MQLLGSICLTCLLSKSGWKLVPPEPLWTTQDVFFEDGAGSYQPDTSHKEEMWWREVVCSPPTQDRAQLMFDIC